MKVTTRRRRPRAAAPGRGRRALGAAEFKAHCLQLLDEVSRTRVPLTVTKRGKPVVQIVPVPEDRPRLFGAHKGRVLYMGDVVSPIDVEWEAER